LRNIRRHLNLNYQRGVRNETHRSKAKTNDLGSLEERQNLESFLIKKEKDNIIKALEQYK